MQLSSHMEGRLPYGKNTGKSGISSILLTPMHSRYPGWDGEMAWEGKSTDYSSRRPGFTPQHSHGVFKQSVALVPEDPDGFLCPSQAPGTQPGTQAYMQAKHPHASNILYFNFKESFLEMLMKVQNELFVVLAISDNSTLQYKR